MHELTIPNSSNVIPLQRVPFAIDSKDSATEEMAKAKFRGPLSGKMWTKSLKMRGRFQDHFDYSIYDQLHARFGENQPRGGVVFRQAMKFTEAADCSKCFYRFEIDTYGRGCLFNCAYCYAKSYLSIHKYWNEPIPFPADIVEIRRAFHTVLETDRKHKLRSLIEKRIPIRIGSMSDSFMRIDQKYKVTQELLKILRFYRYPYLIFTRSDLVAEETYLNLLDKNLASVQMSISSFNSELTKKIEPGAPSPARRISALSKLATEGFRTAVRINPLFPIYPDGYYTDPNFDRTNEVKPFNYFSWDMVQTVAEHKIPTLIVGIARLYRPNIRFMSTALGYSIKEHFPAEAAFERASLHFSEAETDYYYARIKELCTQHGVRFSSCYIGNDPIGASFERYRPMWANKADCCDAVGNIKSFAATCADVKTRKKPEDSASPCN